MAEAKTRSGSSHVVIGGSAGAFDALKTILPSLPASFPAPVVVVLHLHRNDGGSLARDIAARCALRVRVAEDKDPIRRGWIYFGPANYHLLISKGDEFALSIDPPVNHCRPSIDLLFETAAEAWGLESRALS
jgi:two-component system chemotaxis response regulator CheB